MLDKQTIKYFWSFFEKLTIENQYLFGQKDGKWFAYKVSKNETDSSGELDVNKIAKIAKEIEGSSVYIVHNHPSQEPLPSNPDRYQYVYIHSILSLLNIPIEDYLIVSDCGYFSFKEANYLLENIPYVNLPTKAEKIETPNLGFCELVEKEKDTILRLAETYNEFIFNNRVQYGTTSEFDGSFLLKKEAAFTFKSIFFKKRKSDDDLLRLKHIDRMIDPIEIYWIDTNSISPLKLEGVI